MMKTRRWTNRTIVRIVALGVLLIGFLMIMGSCIDPEVVDIPDPNEEPERPVPPRPGTLGIVISGPRIEIPLFAIDESRGSIALDWNRLMSDFPSTDITVPCYIDTAGILTIDYGRINIGSHEDAWVEIIEPAIRTWKYTPIKTGSIVFWFNLPSMGAKLTIYTDGLNKSPAYADMKFVRTGYLFYTSQINRQYWRVVD